MRKLGLLVLSVSAIGCSHNIPGAPPFPEVWQCAVQGNPRAFYCVNTRNGDEKKIPIEHSSMLGAQCLSEKDYASSEAWVAKIEELARQRCSK